MSIKVGEILAVFFYSTFGEHMVMDDCFQRGKLSIDSANCRKTVGTTLSITPHNFLRVFHLGQDIEKKSWLHINYSCEVIPPPAGRGDRKSGASPWR